MKREKNKDLFASAHAAPLPAALRDRLLSAMESAAAETNPDRILEETLRRKFHPVSLPDKLQQHLLERIQKEEGSFSILSYVRRGVYVRRLVAVCSVLLLGAIALLLETFISGTDVASDKIAGDSYKENIRESRCYVQRETPVSAPCVSEAVGNIGTKKIYPQAIALRRVSRHPLLENLQRKNGSSSMLSLQVVYHDTLVIRQSGNHSLIITVPHKKRVEMPNEVI